MFTNSRDEYREAEMQSIKLDVDITYYGDIDI